MNTNYNLTKMSVILVKLKITLIEANSKLKEELETLTNALNKFNKGSFMKNSDLNSLYDE